MGKAARCAPAVISIKIINFSNGHNIVIQNDATINTPPPPKGAPTIFIFLILKFSNAIHHKEYYGTEKENHWVVSKVHISCVNWWAIIIILLIHMLWVKYFWRSHVSRVFHLVDFTVAYWVLELLTAVQVRIAPPTLLWYSPMLTLHITFSIMLLATLHLNVEPSCSYFMNVIMGDLPIKLHHTATHNNSRWGFHSWVQL